MALVAKIQGEDPQIHFNGLKKFGNRYRIDLVDQRTGKVFTISAEEEWRAYKDQNPPPG